MCPLNALLLDQIKALHQLGIKLHVRGRTLKRYCVENKITNNGYKESQCIVQNVHYLMDKSQCMPIDYVFLDEVTLVPQSCF